MRVRACWGHLEALLLLPHLASPSHGGTHARGHATAMGRGRGGESMEIACLRPSIRPSERQGGDEADAPVGPAGSAREMAFSFSLLSPGEIRLLPAAECLLCGGAAGGLPHSCRDPRLGRSVARCIGSWDSEPVAENLGFREFAVYSARLF